jgi:long-chain acyl-CoA synthetase
MEVRRNLAALLLHAVRERPRDDMLMFRKGPGEWDKMSSRQVLDAVREVAAGLLMDGLKLGDRVGILSENRPEWLLVDLATHFAGGIDVPCYPTLPADQVSYLLDDSETRFLVVSNSDQAKKVEQVRDELPNLEHVYCMDGAAPQAAPLSELRARGRQFLERAPGALEERLAGLDPEDLATLIYTSGTTGRPKGVMLTHHNLCSNVAACRDLFPFRPDEVAISFLPLSHVLERMVSYTYIEVGLGIAMVRRIERVPDALSEVRPHVFVTVPRLLSRVYDAVSGQVHGRKGFAGKIARRAFGWADATSDAWLSGAGPSGLSRLRWRVADKTILSRVRDKLGGRLRFLVSGGAALPEHVARFFWSAGIEVYEGYGLTETSPVISANVPGAVKVGTVGRPIHGVDVRITEDGEVIARGPNVMKGYWKRPQETEEVLRAGWFYTGDLGELDEDDFLTLKGRKKEILVLSTGKNISPRSVEETLEQSPFITRVIAVGDEKPSVGVLVVPDEDKVRAWATEQGIELPEGIDLTSDENVRKLIESEIRRLQSNLAVFEKVRKFEFLQADLTEENGLLTPTQKVRRNELVKRYQDLIEGMYES